jgi:hypothetical protein
MTRPTFHCRASAGQSFPSVGQRHQQGADRARSSARPGRCVRRAAKGRHRANVLDYPSVNSLHPARRGELELHPTSKPLAVIADLIRDCTGATASLWMPSAEGLGVCADICEMVARCPLRAASQAKAMPVKEVYLWCSKTAPGGISTISASARCVP